jgi:serine/threonine protein kinase
MNIYNYTEVTSPPWPIINRLTTDEIRLYENNNLSPPRFVTKHIRNRTRARKELQNMLLLQHLPHILNLLNFVENQIDGSIVLFLPYCHIDLLEDLVNLRQFTHRAKCIATAVNTIHTENYYHGDIKPENILLDKENNVFICDFGAMRSCSLPYQFMGSISYKAPETERHVRITDHKATDIFALGTVFFAMIYQRLPHEIHTVSNRGFNSRHEMVSMIRRFHLQGYVHRSIQDLVSRMLHKNPILRPTAYDVITVLEQHSISDRPSSKRRLQF